MAVSPVRLWGDGEWRVASLSGTFHPGVPRAVAHRREKAGARDELSLQVGEEVVLTDVLSNTLWQGYKAGAEGKRGWLGGGEVKTEYYVSRDAVELAPGVSPPLRFLLADDEAEGAECIVVLFQPDVRSRRSYKGDPNNPEVHIKDHDYPKIHIVVKTCPGEEEEVAQEHVSGDNGRSVAVTVTLRPGRPLIGMIAEYGGTGQAYELRMFSRSATATITPLTSEERAVATSYDDAEPPAGSLSS